MGHRVSRGVSLLVCAVAILSGVVTGRAQEGAQQLDQLLSRLEDARAEIDRIQSQAGSIGDRIASIDQEAEAVADALAVAQELVDRTQLEISVIEERIRQKQQLYTVAQQTAENIAVEVYKGGTTAQVEVLLSARTITELTSLMEYSSAATEEQSKVMVTAARLKAALDFSKEQLEGKLVEARDARDEQIQHTQHLADLRRAQTLRLAELREQIEGTQAEVAAIADESARVEEQLASTASTVSAGATGAYGFAWPISGAITSGFGPRWGRMHSGIDIDCVTGDAIRASKTGTVVTATYDGSGYGNYIVIDHGGGFATLYAHMSELYLPSGSVSQGEAIGACGSTGASTGDHLHFEVRVGGTPENPLSYLP